MNMNRVYMSISITLYSHCEPDCTYWERIDDGPITHRKLSLDEARRMQWELVKAGAERKYCSNLFDNAISNVDVDYWARR